MTQHLLRFASTLIFKVQNLDYPALGGLIAIGLFVFWMVRYYAVNIT